MTASVVAIAIDEDDERVSRYRRETALTGAAGSLEDLVGLHLAVLYHGDVLALGLYIG